MLLRELFQVRLELLTKLARAVAGESRDRHIFLLLSSQHRCCV